MSAPANLVGSFPIPFPGTPKEAQANYDTHRFFYNGGPDDGDVRCDNCDCRPSHVAAKYPCGTTVPRQVVAIR